MNLFHILLLFIGVFLGYLLRKKGKVVGSISYRIYNTLTSKGIPVNIAFLAVAQAKHETAMKGIPFTSPLFLRANNAYGYGTVKNNPLQIGTAGKHPEDSGVYAKYETVEKSAEDLAGYLKRRKHMWETITTPDSYATFLKNQKYFTGPLEHYISGLNKFYTKSMS